MPCAADDFRIFWDNAYSVHHLNPFKAIRTNFSTSPKRAEKRATPTVTSSSHPRRSNASWSRHLRHRREPRQYRQEAHGYDRHQLRQAQPTSPCEVLKNADGLASSWQLHADILRPKFTLVENELTMGLSEVGGCTWTKPRGGYFVSFRRT